MTVVRDFREGDLDAVVALSLRAWAPVFVSLERALGGLFARLHPDWRADQERAVREACLAEGMRVWVAEIDGEVAPPAPASPTFRLGESDVPVPGREPGV